MAIEFDPAKDGANLRKHDVPLSRAAESDLDGAVVLADDRFDYGETRYRAFGRVEGRGMCLAFTLRDDRVRAISYRRAHDEELADHGL